MGAARIAKKNRTAAMIHNRSEDPDLQHSARDRRYDPCLGALMPARDRLA